MFQVIHTNFDTSALKLDVGLEEMKFPREKVDYTPSIYHTGQFFSSAEPSI